MVKRSFQILLLIILHQSIFITIHAQTKINSCLFIGDKEKYVLTEKIKLENGQYQTFNSLFIWNKDKVTRIVFLYDRKLAGLSKLNITRLKSFESFLPTFKKYIWYENPKDKRRRSVYVGLSIYDGSFIDKRQGETSGSDYEEKLKAVINGRNKKYNPLADYFGSIAISDGDPEVMIYNDKRKAKAVNNLPLLFNSANGDSSYIISPLHIDIYRVDNSAKNDNAISKEFTGYKLYSTVSFLQQSVKYPTKEFIDEPYKGIKYFIKQHSLSYLYKDNRPLDTGLLMNILSKLPFSDRESGFRNGNVVSPIVETYQEKANTMKDSIRIKRDSITTRETVKRQFLKGDNFDYQHCAECYDIEISKRERIYQHCPLKIALYKNQFNENWSYAFSDEYRHYFKIETSTNQPDWQMVEDAWLLMSPGVGYWMSDVTVNNGKYLISGAYLFLNRKKISE